MKKLFSVCLSVLLLLGAVACTGNNTPAQPSAAATEQQSAAATAQQSAAAEKTVIRLTSAYAVPAFEAGLEAAYPNIDLQVETLPSGVINGEITRRLRNGKGPELILTNLPAGEIAGYAYDLSATPMVEKYNASVTRSIKIEGHNLYLPLPGSYYGYILNKTLLEELGLPVPETTGELLAVLAAAQEKGLGVMGEEKYCFGLSDIGATFLGAYFTAGFAPDFLSGAEGAKWLSSFEDKQAAFTGVWEGAVDFLKACVDLGYLNAAKLIVLYNGHIDSDSTAFKAEEQLPARTAILTYGDIAMYERIRAASQDEIIMLPCLPADKNGNKLLSAVSNNYIAVNKAIAGDEKTLQAALTVMDYLSTPEGQANWILDSRAPHSYLIGYTVAADTLPESIRSYAQSGMVFTNPFPTNLLSYLGKKLCEAAKGKTSVAEALSAIDDYNLNGSEDVEYDLSIVGTVAVDMLYENANTRKQETLLGNFITDAIREVTGADIVLVNGGGIRSSFYKGDITGDDLDNVCPYGNLIIIAEMDGATLRAAITNGIQKTWKPAGQFLQVSGAHYSYRPAANETETAELLTLTYPDGKEIQDSDRFTVAYTNYMGGSSGYVDAGDGFTMLNVYDSSLPVTVKLTEETGLTYGQALVKYFAAHKDAELSAVLEGRIVIN